MRVHADTIGKSEQLAIVTAAAAAAAAASKSLVVASANGLPVE